MIAESLAALVVPVDDLTLLPGNPRRGDVTAVARSLAAFGQRKPIVANRDGTVIAGNHTLQAARELGWTEIAVVHVDDDDATAKAYALADNRTAELGTYDDDDLAAFMVAVQEADADLLAATGWAVDDIARLVGPPPTFDPISDDELPRLDQRNATMCPQCGFEWRVGPRDTIEPV